jgi:hypothetical protein
MRSWVATPNPRATQSQGFLNKPGLKRDFSREPLKARAPNTCEMTIIEKAIVPAFAAWSGPAARYPAKIPNVTRAITSPVRISSVAWHRLHKSARSGTYF